MDNKLVTQLKDTTKEIAAIETEIMDATVTLQKRLAGLRQTDTEVRAAIKEAMIANNVKKFDSDELSITLVAATVRRGLDTAAIRDQEPDIYEKYLKETPVSASVRIKIK